jgi:transcriptional regulator with XRE-family HTH domain
MRTIDKIIKRLEAFGQDQKWLALQVGIREDRISRWKDGKGEPTGSQLLAIARVLGLPIEYLADPTMERPPEPPISFDQRQVLDLVGALGLGKAEALRRLSCPPMASAGGDGTPVKVHPEAPAPAPKSRLKRDPNR